MRQPADGVYIYTPEDCPDRAEINIPNQFWYGAVFCHNPRIGAPLCNLENCPRHYANPMGVYRQ